MSSTRREIREVTTSLLTGATRVGDSVFSSRIRPNREKDLPVINIYTVGESVTDYGEAPLLNKRVLDLICEIITSNPESDEAAAAQADDIADEIESVLFKEDANVNGKLGCLVDMIRLSGVTIDYDAEGESAINTCRLSFAVTYSKEAVTDEADNTNELDLIGADWDINTANDPDPEAQDLIELGP